MPDCRHLHPVSVALDGAPVIGRLGAPCGSPNPVCPHCLGVGLYGQSRSWTCRSCGRAWAEGTIIPCPTLARVLLEAPDGGRVWVCVSHAAHPSLQLWRHVEP